MIKRLKGKNLIILVLIGIALFGFVRQARTIKRIEGDIAERQKELESLKEENQRLQDEVKSTNSDEYQEKLARDRLKMVKPGEKIVNDKKSDSNSDK